MPISSKTAMDIALAHREVETAEKLLAEIEEARSRFSPVDIRDAFGRRQDGLQLGVPSGNNGHRIFNLPWEVCRPVIELHIANQRAQIQILSEKAMTEMRDMIEKSAEKIGMEMGRCCHGKRMDRDCPACEEMSAETAQSN